MMSMSGGWFFVVASEAISVGNIQIALPGIGSYVALAIQQRDLAGVGWAIVAMTITILIYDQLLFRPLVAWAHKFRFEQTAAPVVPRSWVLDLFRGAGLLRFLGGPISRAVQAAARAPLALSRKPRWLPVFAPPRRAADLAWGAFLLACLAYVGRKLVQFAEPELSWGDVTIA